MQKNIATLGYYSSLVSFIAILAYGVVQVLQVVGWVTYPLDDILIYTTSLCIAPPFLLAMLAVHYSAPVEKKIWSHAALLFAVMYNIFVILMYVVQLATVIPASLKDPANNILTVTPHSLFWTIDALGYICMGIATFFAAFVFAKDSIEKQVMRFCIANGLMVPVIALVYFYPHFSVSLLFLAFPWIITASGSMLALALLFKRSTGEILEMPVRIEKQSY